MPSLFAATAALLLSLWLGLTAWIVGARLRHDRLRRNSSRDAALLCGGMLDPGRCGWRRLWRVADGDFGATSVEAARELVLRYPSRITRLARRSRPGRTRALRVLARSGSSLGIEALAAARLGAAPELVAAVVAIAAELQTPAADELLLDVLVRGDHPRSRTATELQPRVPRVLERLLTLAAGEDPELRYWALMLLRERAGEASVRAAAVAAAVDPQATVRAAAARVLGAGHALDDLPALRALLADSAFFVRAHAARAAGELGATPLAQGVAGLLRDTSWWVRAAARESLLSLGDAGLGAAAAMLESDDRFAREGADEVVASFERRDASAEDGSLERSA
jgi:hypothetical protein